MSVRPSCRIAVIILNWRDPEPTLACVHGLRPHLPADRNVRIYVFDNEASPATRQALAPLQGAVTLLSSPVNLGYTGGNNAAIAAALSEGADYLWLLNNDARVGPDVLASLLRRAEADPRIGLASPLLRQDAQALAYAAVRFDAAEYNFPSTLDLPTARDWQDRFPDRCILWGTALLIRRSLVEAIGVLDDRFFAYGEDIDYSIRSLAAGFRNHIEFGSEVLHPVKEYGSSANPPYYYYLRSRNDILLLRKHCPLSLRPRAAARLAYRGALLLEQLAGHPELAEAWLAGAWHGIRGVTGPYRPNGRMPRPLAAAMRARPALIGKLLDAI